MQSISYRIIKVTTKLLNTKHNISIVRTSYLPQDYINFLSCFDHCSWAVFFLWYNIYVHIYIYINIQIYIYKARERECLKINNSKHQFQAGDNGVLKLCKIRSFPRSIKKSGGEENKKGLNYQGRVRGEGRRGRCKKNILGNWIFFLQKYALFSNLYKKSRKKSYFFSGPTTQAIF